MTENTTAERDRVQVAIDDAQRGIERLHDQLSRHRLDPDWTAQARHSIAAFRLEILNAKHRLCEIDQELARRERLTRLMTVKPGVMMPLPDSGTMQGDGFEIIRKRGWK